MIAQIVPVVVEAEDGAAERPAVQGVVEEVVELAQVEVVGLKASVHPEREHRHIDGVAEGTGDDENDGQPTSPSFRRKHETDAVDGLANRRHNPFPAATDGW